MFTVVKLFRIPAIVLTLFCFVLPSVVNARCLGNVKDVDGILVISHEPLGENGRLFVDISAPLNYEGLPYSHMGISRGKNEYFELSAKINTVVEENTVRGSIMGLESEIAFWEVSVLYKQRKIKADSIHDCSLEYVSRASLEHNKTRNELDATVVGGSPK